jgi:hypothetical protein
VEVRMQLLRKHHHPRKRMWLLLQPQPLRCPARPRRCGHPWNRRLCCTQCMKCCLIAWHGCMCCEDVTWLLFI